MNKKIHIYDSLKKIHIYDRNMTEIVKKQIEYQYGNTFRNMRIVGPYNDIITKNDYIREYKNDILR